MVITFTQLNQQEKRENEHSVTPQSGREGKSFALTDTARGGRTKVLVVVYPTVFYVRDAVSIVESKAHTVTQEDERKRERSCACLFVLTLSYRILEFDARITQLVHLMSPSPMFIVSLSLLPMLRLTVSLLPGRLFVLLVIGPVLTVFDILH